MKKIENYNSKHGFTLVVLLITVAIMVLLMFGVYFGFNKITGGNQPDQPTPSEAIEEANDAKNLIESQQKSLNN